MKNFIKNHKLIILSIFLAAIILVLCLIIFFNKCSVSKPNYPEGEKEDIIKTPQILITVNNLDADGEEKIELYLENSKENIFLSALSLKLIIKTDQQVNLKDNK